MQFNTAARITVQGGEQPPSFLVQAPRRGDAFTITLVTSSTLPLAYQYLAAALLDGTGEALNDPAALCELQQIGLLVAPEELSQPVSYPMADWTSDTATTTAIPAAALPWSVPAEWQAPHIRFVRCPESKLWMPVQIDPAQVSPKTTPDTEISGANVSETPPSDISAAKLLQDEGYAALDALLPPSAISALATYFRNLGDQGYLERRESRGVRRLIAHNHPVAQFWHHQLNQRISALAGRPTKPSYSFVSSYLQGSDLFWHTDRPPCEYTITLLIDYAPLSPDGRSGWPLLIRRRDDQIASVRQRIGDALLFKGRELPHSRDHLPQGHQSLSLLFHYVNADYAGELD